MKKNKKISKTYSGDHVSVILEEMRDQFGVFGDRQQSLIDQIDRMDIRLSKVEDRSIRDGLKLSGIDVKMDSLKRDIKDSYKSTAEFLSRIESEIQSIKAETEELKVRLKDKADLVKLFDLEKRVIRMEKLVFAKLG